MINPETALREKARTVANEVRYPGSPAAAEFAYQDNCDLIEAAFRDIEQATIERCAQIADGYAHGDRPQMKAMAEVIAAAIRASEMGKG